MILIQISPYHKCINLITKLVKQITSNLSRNKTCFKIIESFDCRFRSEKPSKWEVFWHKHDVPDILKQVVMPTPA